MYLKHLVKTQGFLNVVCEKSFQRNSRIPGY